MCTYICMHVHLMQLHYAVTMADDDLDEAALDAWRAFLTAHALVTRRISRDLVDAGLPDLGWYDLLWALRRNGGRLRVNELAREVVLSPTAMSRFVDRAVAAGVVTREPDPDDRRASQVVLTEEGEALLRRMWPVYREGIAEHFAEHLGDDPGKLSATLGRIAESARGRGV
jgi:DNA-binding MarR family transcriptional regulator